jgi:hypothetical protein
MRNFAAGVPCGLDGNKSRERAKAPASAWLVDFRLQKRSSRVARALIRCADASLPHAEAWSLAMPPRVGIRPRAHFHRSHPPKSEALGASPRSSHVASRPGPTGAYRSDSGGAIIVSTAPSRGNTEPAFTAATAKRAIRLFEDCNVAGASPKFPRRSMAPAGRAGQGTIVASRAAGSNADPTRRRH